MQLETFSKTTEKGANLKPWHIKPGEVRNPNGRPKGSRNKLSEDFISELYADFQKAGAEAIARCRQEKPDVYVRVIAGLLPQKLEISRTDEMSQEDIDRAILRATSLLREVTESRASGASGSEGEADRPNEAVSLPAS